MELSSAYLIKEFIKYQWIVILTRIMIIHGTSNTGSNSDTVVIQTRNRTINNPRLDNRLFSSQSNRNNWSIVSSIFWFFLDCFGLYFGLFWIVILIVLYCFGLFVFLLLWIVLDCFFLLLWIVLDYFLDCFGLFLWLLWILDWLIIRILRLIFLVFFVLLYASYNSYSSVRRFSILPQYISYILSLVYHNWLFPCPKFFYDFSHYLYFMTLEPLLKDDFLVTQGI